MNRTFVRALAAFLFAGAIPVCLTLSMMGWSAKRWGEQSGFETLNRLAEHVSREIQLSIASSVMELKSLPSEPNLVVAEDREKDQLEEFQHLAAIHDRFTEFTLYDEDGYVIASSSKTPSTLEATSWFQNALQGQTTLSRPYVSRLSDDLEFSLYLPVEPAPGRDVAVIKARLPFHEISQMIQNIPLDPGNRLLILDRYGNLLADNRGNWFQRLEQGETMLQAPQGTLDLDEGAYHYVAVPFTAAGMLAEESMTLGWLVPTESFTASHKRTLTYVTIAATISILPVGGLSLLFARSLTAPLIRTANNASKLASGDRFDSIPEIGTIEMQQLTRVLNDTVGKLKSRAQDLVSANQKLEEASRTKDQFLSIISHELRTPLNAILGFSEALEQGIYGPLSAPQLECVHTIEDSGVRLLTQINDALNAARLVSGEFSLNKKRVSVSELLRVATSKAQEAANKKGHQIIVKVPADIGHIEADDTCLLQLMEQLMSNAIKFTSDHGVIQIQAHSLETEEEVEIRVSDSGIGIREEDLPKLFQRFVQLDGSHERSYSGTGIGLYCVKAIAEMHEGTVAVESTFGQGTTFIVRIPRGNPEEAIKPSDLAVADSASELKEAVGQPETQLPSSSEGALLLVDDNELSIVSLRSLARALKLELIVARTGEEAEAVLEETQPLAVLLDLDLEAIDIATTLKRFRATALEEDMPILGLRSEQTSLAIEELDLNATLNRPVRLPNLREALMDLSLSVADSKDSLTKLPS